MNEGILYLACGFTYYEQALYSVKSLRRHMPDINVTLACDYDYASNDPRSIVNGRPCFDQFIHIDHDSERPYRSKSRIMSRSPYEKTIYLDCDTVVLDNFSEIFKCLDIFDCGASLNVHRGPVYKYGDIQCLATFNSSTFAYRKSDVMGRVFADFQEQFDAAASENPRVGDQEILSYCIIRNGAKFWVLPEEYNFHLMHMGRAFRGIKIATSHEQSAKDAAAALNSSLAERVWVPLDQTLIVDTYFDVYFGKAIDRNIVKTKVV